MSRASKIARLPLSIREELNRRLQNGEPATNLVEWLNAQPEAQKILQHHFEGRPFDDQNLSEWKQGGFQDWICLQEIQGWLQESQDYAKTLGFDSATPSPSDSLSSIMAMALARCLKESMDAGYDTPQKQACIRDMVREINELRRRDHAYARIRLERERFETQKAQEERRIQIVTAARCPSPSPFPSDLPPRRPKTPYEEMLAEAHDRTTLFAHALNREKWLAEQEARKKREKRRNAAHAGSQESTDRTPE